jgi:gamma-glutamyltranspeptidase/glutathione hydrolase
LPPDSTSDGAEAVLACDGRGTIAALAYVPARQGVAVPELEVTLGLSAVPVRRGVTRVAPGTLLPAPAPVAIAVQTGGFAAAVALPGSAVLDAAAVAELARGTPVEAALAALRDRAAARAGVAVLTDGKTARAVAV